MKPHHCPLQIPPTAAYFLEETWHYGVGPLNSHQNIFPSMHQGFFLRRGVVFILHPYETNVYPNLSTSKSTYTPWNQYDPLKILEINGYFYFLLVYWPFELTGFSFKKTPWFLDHGCMKTRSKLNWTDLVQESSCIQCSYAMKFFEQWLIRKKLIQI